MINITKELRQNCCGCHGCAQICPTSCIDMKMDEEGFKYPIIDKDRCIKCNKCEKVCPIIEAKKNDNIHNDSNNIPLVLGGWHKDNEVREKSSSGGAFTLFAEHIIKNGGIVFGAGFNEKLQVNHMSIENIEDLDKLRGSKYSQSNINDTYLKVKENLENDRMVLFVGTPCQCSGLKSFLNKDYDKLFKCDFICHGVPSPLVFENYKLYLEEKYKDKIVEFKFRNKERGWKPRGQMGTIIKFEKGRVKKFMPAYKDFYMNGFLTDIYLRPSCHECEFKSIPKTYSDITLADFWGVNKLYPELYDNKGTSLVFIHTKGGKELFEKVKENFHYRECDFDKSIRKNPSLLKSSKPSGLRKSFFEQINNNTSFKNLSLIYLNVFSRVIQMGVKLIKRK